MTNDQNPRGAQFETPFDHIKDVNEFVLAARAYWAERNKNPDWLELADEDAAMDYLLGCVAGWIVLREQLPIDSKERVTQIFESVINALRKIQSSMPEDQAELRRDLLHLLRRQYIVRKGDSQS
jgi:hypothetical protein